MHTAAIYHEARTPLCCALDKETLQITLRAGLDVQRVTLIYADPYEAGIAGGAVAIISIICTRRSQRLGDMAAGTTVVRRSRPSASLLADPYDAPADYEVVFPQAALLSDSDLRVIREVLAETKRRADYSLLPPLATRVKAITGITSDLPNLQLLETLLRDASRLAR